MKLFLLGKLNCIAYSFTVHPSMEMGNLLESIVLGAFHNSAEANPLLGQPIQMWIPEGVYF